eukprot:GHRR01027027.1.p1 GENE.GHRR01027027.1~~GHRR01027027.1.p1  ORF type:complete len:120 (+),score=23.22 GHRR01027027.1:486-845(+)
MSPHLLHQLKRTMRLCCCVTAWIVSCHVPSCVQTPSLACVEMMQCIAQAVPTSVRKPGGKADSLAPLLQLPGINQGHIKNLRKRKINTLAGEMWLVGAASYYIDEGPTVIVGIACTADE